MLVAAQVNFTDLSDFQKLMYTTVSVDFKKIGEVR